MSKPNKTIAEKTADLQNLLDWFDSDDFELEQAIEKFQIAKQLADEVVHDLDELENEIMVVQQDFSTKTNDV